MNRWCDGLGRYGGTTSYMLNGSSSQAWAEVGTGFSLSTANPRTGTHHLRYTNGTGSRLVRRVFGDPLTEVFFGQALYFQGLPDAEPVVGTSFRTGFFIAKFRSQVNGAMISVWLGTDGAIVVYRDGEEFAGDFIGTELGRSSPCVGAGAYMHFEHYLKVGNSTGAYELRVDEQTVLNLTGIDTDMGYGEVSQITMGSTGPGGGSPFSGSVVVDIADLYVNDTDSDGSACDTFIGDCKSGYRAVNADTAQADFALSAGPSGYALLDEAPPNDSDYISTASSTAQSDFGIADGPANSSEILTARPFVRAMKDDAGTCTIAPSLISNAVKATVDDQPVATAFSYYDSNVPLNPDTGVPWTPAELDAASEVVERTA